MLVAGTISVELAVNEVVITELDVVSDTEEDTELAASF